MLYLLSALSFSLITTYRFGRKVWYSLPKELLEEEVDLIKLEKMFDDDKLHILNTMNTRYFVGGGREGWRGLQ